MQADEEHAQATEDSARDPVCGMLVPIASAQWQTDHAGKTYVFCCDGCLARFQSEPSRYASSGATEPTHTGHAPSRPQGDGSYTCPMHPEIVRSAPGSCPICGMALEPRSAGLDDAPNPELVDMTHRLAWSLPLAAILWLLGMSDIFPWQPLEHLTPPGVRNWIELVIASPVVLLAGWPFFARGVASVVRLRLNMFTLIALGTGAAYAFSVAATVAPQVFPASFRAAGETGERVGVYFEAAAVIIVLVIVGQVLELRARARTGNAIASLLRLAPKTARRVRDDGSEEDVPIERIHRGNRLRIRPGERIPCDGIVVEGKSAIDESTVTGESLPVEKETGSPVVAGTLNGNGGLLVVAERVGDDTLLAQIVRLVADAQRSKPAIVRLADKVSSVFVPIVLLISALTFVVWALAGPEPRMAHALVNAVAVLIIACPCALGLATPMSIMVGIGRAATMGVLFKDAQSLERLREIDVLVVDKTGTLTEGKPVVATVALLHDRTLVDVLRMAATLERASEHPLADAIAREAQRRGIHLGEASAFRSISGKGVVGRVDDKDVAVGNAALLEELAVTEGVPHEQVEQLRARGETVVFVIIEGRIAGYLGITDPIKESALGAIAALRTEGVSLRMLTGDATTNALAVAQRLGIAEVESEVLPAQKGEAIKNLREAGKIVAMAGDGINDAPALASADVGIAMGVGADVAVQSAGVILVRGNLRGIARARALSRATMTNIRQNLWLSFVYNALGIPVAAGVLYPALHILASPMIASAAMSLSSVSVIANALRLRSMRIG